MKFLSARVGALFFALLAGTVPALAQNNGLPGAVRSNAFVQMVAERGLECDLLKPWESAALMGMVADDMSRRPEDMMAQMQTEAARLSAETACDAQALNVWIEGASPGFEREILPPYLVAYAQLARLETPPEVFTRITTLEDHGQAIEQIEAKIDALGAAGVTPEGGMSWPEYVERVDEFIAGFMALTDSGDAESAEVAQAAGLIEQSVRITELWLQEP